MRNRWLMFLVVFYVSSPVMGSETTIIEEDVSQPAAKLEAGLTIGLPSAFNAYAAVWLRPPHAFVFGISGNYLGTWFQGVQGDLGFVVWPGIRINQLLGVTLGTYRHERSNFQESGNYFGPYYGLRWLGFKLQLGLGYGWGGTRTSGLAGYGQIGYTFLL